MRGDIGGEMTPLPLGLAGFVVQDSGEREHPIKIEFDEAYALVEGKAHDYAEEGNVYSNFELAAEVAGISVEQVFLVLIAIKIARLGQLIGNDKEPNNESIDDSAVDGMNYFGLFKAYLRQLRGDTHDHLPLTTRQL